MSLIRVGHHGRITGHRKRTASKKPGWDSTIHDLSVYKATREEQVQRTRMHQSKNHMAVKLEKMRKESDQKENVMSPADIRKRAIMKEILYDQSQLEDVLSKSDKMMAVVKDLFGDDPKRYTGFPNVTSVPSGAGDYNRSSIVAPVPEIYTRMDALSETVTNPTALNEYQSSESDEEASGGQPIMYEPKMNLQRFQQFIASEEERNQTLSSISGPNQASHCETGPIHSTRLQDSRGFHSSQDGSGFETPKKEHDESISMLRTPKSAINDTKRIKRTKKRVSPQKSSNIGSSAMQFTDFRKVLINLQEEIAEFEKQTGRSPPAEQQRSDTLSGYTVALVDAVTKLARYLRQTDLRLQGEVAVRETLTQDMFQFRIIVDSLTTDLIFTQEEYAKLVGEFEKHRSATTDEIAGLRHELQELKRLCLSPEQHTVTGAQKTSPTQRDLSQGDVNASALCVSQETSVKPEIIQSQHSAVMLSPMVRKTRIPEAAEVGAAMQKRQTSLIDISSLAETGPHQHFTAFSSQPQPFQAPPTAATVTVPRPQPLVQCNVRQAWQDVVPNTIEENVTRNAAMRNDSMQSCSSSSSYQAMPGAGTNRNIASQIAELNKQHEEAQKRMQLLLQQQKGHYSQLQQEQHHHQQQPQHHLQSSQHQQQIQQTQPVAQRLHVEYHQQNQQQQQQHQHPVVGRQQQQQQHPADERYWPQQPVVERYQPQQPVVERYQPQQPQHRTHVQQYYTSQNGQQNQVEISTEPAFGTVTSHIIEEREIETNTQFGFYNKNLAGVQAVSPPISPISQRSERFTQTQQANYKEPGREITVAIPTAGLDMSGESLPSPRVISAHQ